MPEQYTTPRSKYQDEKECKQAYADLGRKITDKLAHKLHGVTTDDPEYWGLREVLTDEMVEVALKMTVRQFYTFEELMKMNPDMNPVDLQKLLDEMAVVGILEFDYGDHYNDDGPIPDAPREKRYRICYFVPGSAELFNSTRDRVDKNPAVASFFERMTFIALAGVTEMVPPGGNGIGMHVIPVEEAVNFENEAIKLERISYWLKKYEGHISAGMCSCRYAHTTTGDGCADDPDDWCIQLGDMADYTVETGRAHYITTEEALEILKKSEDNGFVHQITNIDGEDKIFDICNCDVKICNALRTSMLFNTPNLSRSSYTAKVDPKNCVACGLCVESCPAGAVKLGQKLCKKDGTQPKYPRAILPDAIRWGKYAWDENYRDTARLHNSWPTGTAPCKAACPAHVPVQAYLKKAREGKYQEAVALIKTMNPFPSVCGRVCNKSCESACTRGTIDAAVAIDDVKRFVSDYDRATGAPFVPKKVVPSLHGKFDEKIAIIGAGPAGLSCANYLALMGYTPTVFEKRDLPGGMMEYGIPTYKLEKDVLAEEIRLIQDLGVEIKCGVEVGKDVTIEDLKKQGYQAFYIAIGCQGGRRPGVPGDTAEGTDIAVHYLQESMAAGNPPMEGKVVVVGGGNVAADCARNAARRGAGEVYMVSLEQRDEMPASDEEVEESLSDGVQIENGWGPKEVLTDENGHVRGIVFKKCTRTIDPETGRFSPLYDESVTREVACDHIVFAIGQAIEWGSLLDGTAVSFHHGDYPVADELTFQTDEPSIFVGGDVYTGPKFVIDAVAEGHYAAESLHRYVHRNASMTIGRDRHDYQPFDKDDLSFGSYDTYQRQVPASGAEGEDRFRDVSGTLTEEQVKTECSRCLSCGASVVDPNKCIGCGICTTRCEFDAIHIHRDHPEMSKMVRSEDKTKGILSYQLKRIAKIAANRNSEEAKIMRAKREEWERTHDAEWQKAHPYTGNAYEE